MHTHFPLIETIIYYIVAAVVGGVLLVVVVIVIVCVAVCCMKRMGKGKRRMSKSITHYLLLVCICLYGEGCDVTPCLHSSYSCGTEVSHGDPAQ